jgi:predicted TIM-barrel fold metal-dependent hydrolase
MIIDVHTHIYEAGHGGPFDLPASADALLRDMDESGVDVSVVLPLPGVASNGFVQAQCARFPDRLVGLYTPEFNDPHTTIARMEQFFQDHNPPGFKIHPRVQGIRVTDSIVRDVLSWASERALTVLFDVFPYGPDMADLRLHPLAYHTLAQEMPNLTMVLAHAGGYKVLEAFLVAKTNPRVFLDVSFTPVYFKGSSAADDIPFLCQRLPEGRVLYGSDFPHVRLREALASAMQWAGALKATKRDALFGDAAAALFRIPRRGA